MSRQSIVLILAALIVAGVGAYLLFFRGKPPGELDIAAKELPELPAPKVGEGDWAWWRGPTRDNHSPDAEAPTKWSETENVAWKTPIPGRGHSSPILVGNRIFLTSADEQAQRQFVLGIDRGTGKVLWEKTVHEKNFPRKHGDNTYASGTPASDGERLFVVFPNNNAIHVTALDLDGKNVLWQREVGPHGGSGTHGSATSLLLWGSYVLLCDDSPNEGRGWIAAVHREKGEIAWRKGHKTGMGSYGSLAVADFNGKPHLIHAGNDRVAAYDPKTGEPIWEAGKFGEVSANTPVIGANMVFASTGVPRKMMAVRADGSVAWTRERSGEIPYPPSMLFHDGHLYIVSDNGFAACLAAGSGDTAWSERLRGSYYASPLLVGKNVYACNRDGLTTIFAASPDGYEEVARNKLDAGINASPVAVGGKLYVRTDTHLYCIGK